MSVYLQRLKKHLYIVLIGFLLIFNYSCDLIKRNEKTDLVRNEIKDARIALDTKEANLLVNVSILNLKILSLSKKLKEKSNGYGAKILATTFEKEHNKIKNMLSEVGDEKIISLPDTLIKNQFNRIDKKEADFSSKEYLEKISEFLNKQIKQLKYLYAITDDIDFKVMAVKILVRLNYNQKKINI